MTYISIKDKKWRVFKKQIGKDNGNPIYREILEFECEYCNRVFESDIHLDFDGMLNIKCSYCN